MGLENKQVAPINRQERLQAHQVDGTWMPYPEGHMQSIRDAQHYYWTLAKLKDMPKASIIDIGCYDGWLDFLLIRKGFNVDGVELIPELARSAMAYASANNLQYLVYNNFFDLTDPIQKYDVALAYEVLEHIPLESVPAYVAKMEGLARRRILISLPDQKHEDNSQHLWTPSVELICDTWGNNKAFSLERAEYNGTDIPANFFISWDL